MKRSKTSTLKFRLIIGLSCSSIYSVSGLDITEIFSFTCIHCYNVEPQVEQLAQQPNIKFIPVLLYDQTNINEVATINAYFAAKSLGKEMAFRNIYFSAIFNGGYTAYTPATLKYVLDSIGLNNSDFYKLASSKTIINNVNYAANLAIKYGATGTPTFIANGHFYEGEDALQQIINSER